jgi:hypothetical protein
MKLDAHVHTHHSVIEQRRHDVAELLPYLWEQEIFGAIVHFREEDQFNRSLLLDLVARPAAMLAAARQLEAA